MASSPGGPDLPALTPTTQNEPRTPSSLTSDSPSPVAAEPEAANAVREQPETGPPTDSEDHAPQGTTHDPVSPALDAQVVAKREAPMLPSFPATEAASPPSGTQPAVAETVPANTPETQADELWQRLIQEVGKLPGEGLTRARMEALRPVAFRGGTLHVGSDDSVPSEHRDYLQSKERAKVLDTCLARLLPGVGRNVLIKRFIAGVSTEDPPPRRRRASPEVREAVGRDAFVRGICDLFDGSVIDVRPKEAGTEGSGASP